MNDSLFERIARTAGIPNLVEVLNERLSATDLNSLLLEVFNQKSQQISPAELLRNYRQNRFTQASATDAIAYADFSLAWLKATLAFGFEPIQLSPVCPLGTCSVVATAHQNKVVSALRGVEVVADSTNVLALESAAQRISENFPREPLCFSTLHRHVRAQEIPDIPGFSAHFGILGLTSAGRDLGNFDFEKTSLAQHLRFYKTYFETTLESSR